MNFKEPIGAFPYKPPSEEIKRNYKYIFEMESSLDFRFFKRFFDIFLSLTILIFCIPIILVIKISYVLEGLIIKDNSGPILFFYYAVSQGKVFKKYKIRVIKPQFIDQDKANRGEWEAYTAEWSESTRTITGYFVKKFYLDEIPQFYSVLIGEMSIVGPRPLAIIHYERDCEQGNVTRKILKGGLLGLGHINKGTPEMGNPIYEYIYIDKYIKSSSFGLFLLDIKIIFRGLSLIIRGGGH